MRIPFPLAAFALASLAAAQTSTYANYFSPKAAATFLGNTSNSIPFSFTPCAYQQVHSRSSFNSTTPKAISSMSFRMGSGWAFSPGFTIDVEIFMAESPNDAATASTAFASNVVPATEVSVYTRKNLNLPLVPDNSWSITFPFDQKFAYTGNAHISWRANAYGNSNGNAAFTYPLDAFGLPGVSTLVGAGCKSASGTANATHTISGNLVINGIPFYVGNSFVVTGGLPAILVIGASNTTFGGIPLPLSLSPYGAPGCSVYNDWAIVLAGVTQADANGSVAILVPIPDDPSLLYAPHYSQFYFVQPTANALGVFTSNGRFNLPGGPHGVSRIYNVNPPPQATGTPGLHYGMAICLN